MKEIKKKCDFKLIFTLFAIAIMLMFTSTATWANYIGDLVYCDQDGDGIFEPGDGDFGLQDVTVTVSCVDGNNVQCDNMPKTTTTATDADTSDDFTSAFPLLDDLCNPAWLNVDDVTGRYVVDVFSNCKNNPRPWICTVEVDQGTAPEDCNILVTPIFGGPPSDGNNDGDFCDDAGGPDGPFPEGEVLGGAFSRVEELTCEQDPDPAPKTGIYTVNTAVGVADDCALYNDFGFKPCGLTLEKGCEIPPPAPPSVGKCEGKLQQFTVIWNGDDPIDFTLGDGLSGSSALSANPGDEVTFTADGSTNDTIVNINGVGQSTFHVSCSDKDMDGDTATNEDQQQVSPVGRDCGKDQGDGKGDSGFINQWLLEGFVDKEGAVLDCTVDDEIGDDSCSFQAVSADCKFPKEKPDTLTFRVSGGDCSASDNAQKPDKTECTGGSIDSLEAVQVSVNGGTAFTLQPGETFDVPRDGDPEIELTQDGVTQFNKFHASCSQPLQAGDRYGANELVALDGAGLGTEVIYSYVVENTGPGILTNIAVTDDQLGEVPGSPIASLAKGESETLTAKAFITETTENTAAAVANSGCAAESGAVVVNVKPPPPCEVAIVFDKLEDDKIKWKLTNVDGRVATLDTLTVNFPPEYGLIKEVKLDGGIFKKGDSDVYPNGVPSGSTIGPNDWTEDDVTKRQLDPGETRTLEVVFTEKSKGEGWVDILLSAGTATFEEGCAVELIKPSGCDIGKPTALIFEYTGEGCTASDNSQDDDKVDCSGDPNGAEPVQVVMTKDADKFEVSPGSVNLGDNFEISMIEDGKEFPSEIKFDIRQGGVTLQSLRFHTSCSQPLRVGDQFGSAKVTEFFPKF